MSKGRVFRVVIGDKGYDLMGAFSKASARDWAALIGATGRNPFTVAQRLGELERVQKAGDEATALLAGPVGSGLVELVGDLIFLARRLEGEREPGTDRPITPDTSFAMTPIMETFGALGEMMMERGAADEDAEPDPT